MPRNITVTFADGTSHTYRNAPDDLTPEQAEARAQQDFPGKAITNLDGGRINPDAPRKQVPDFPETEGPATILTPDGDGGDYLNYSLDRAISDIGGSIAAQDRYRKNIENAFRAPVKAPTLEQRLQPTSKEPLRFDRPGALKSAAVGTGENLGAGAGALGGAAFGAGIGAMGGPAGFITVPVGALLFGGLGAWGGHRAQRKLESSMLPEEVLAALQYQRKQAAEEHPLAYMAGSALPGMAGSAPATGLKSLALGAGLGGAFEVGGQTLRGQGYDPAKIAVATGLGAAGADSNRLGKALFGEAPSVLQRQLMDSEQSREVSEGALEAVRRAGVEATPAMIIPEGDLVRSVGATGANPAASSRLRTAGEGVSQQSNRMAAETAEKVYPEQGSVTAQALIDEAERIKGSRLTDAERAEIEAIDAAQKTKAEQALEAERSRVSAVTAAEQQKEAARRAADEAREALRKKYLAAKDEAAAAKGALPSRVEKASEGVLPETRGGAPAAYTELRQQRDAARDNFKQLYKDAEAAGDVELPAEYAPAIADELAATAKSYAGTLEAGEAPATERIVAKIAKALEERGGLTFMDLNSLRRQLQLVAGKGDTDSFAAGSVIKKIDEIEDRLFDSGWFGDSDVVGKWRAANQARREFGQNWENNTFEKILEGQDPQAMTVTLFGTPSGPPVRGPNRESDIISVMGRLSPEAQSAVRQDAIDRLFSKDIGKPTFGKAFRKWERENPELAQVLVPQEARDAVVRARGDIASAQRDVLQATRTERSVQREFTEGWRQAAQQIAAAEDAARAEIAQARTAFSEAKNAATVSATEDIAKARTSATAARTSAEADFEAATSPVTLGQGFTEVDPLDFTRGLEGLTPQQRNRVKVGARQVIRDSIRAPINARNLLSSLADNERAQANLRSLLGDDEAYDVIVKAKAAQHVLERAEDLQGLARGAQRRGPMSSEETGNVAPQGVMVRHGAGGPEASVYARAINSVTQLLASRGVSRAEALELADALLDPAQTQRVVDQLAEQVGMDTAQLAARRARAIHADTGRRLGMQAGVQAVQSLRPAPQPQLEEPPAPEPERANMASAPIPQTIPGDEGLSVGERNNNPGNLVDNDFTQRQPGYLGPGEGGFAKFDTVENGNRAQENLLENNYKGMTIDQIIEKYAPANENSAESRANYKAYVAKRLGIGINDVPTDMRALADAMRAFETGNT